MDQNMVFELQITLLLACWLSYDKQISILIESGVWE